jgi:hypothetical protein
MKFLAYLSWFAFGIFLAWVLVSWLANTPLWAF